MNALTRKKVFVDNCVISVSDTMQGVKKKQTISWGGFNHTIDIVGYQRKPLPHKSHAWKRQQIQCLPTVGRVARQALISLYTYPEAQFEGWKRPGSYPRPMLGNVFEGVEIKQVEAAVERSYFFVMELGKYIERDSVIEFCEWLLAIEPVAFTERVAGIRELPGSLLRNLLNVGRFRELCAGLSARQYPDALHLWTAEVNGAEYFLTIDRKFIRAMTETKKVRLPCFPLSPSQLLDELKIHERDPFKYGEGQFYDVGGNPC